MSQIKAILRYMVGLVDFSGDESGDNFDPHKHRKVAKPTSYSDTMIHLLKGSLGAGILAMPDATKSVGIFVAAVGVALVCMVVNYCLLMLISAQYKLCKRYKRGYIGYPKSMRLALKEGPTCLHRWGGFFAYFVDAMLVIWQLGICVIYYVFIASNIKEVCDYYQHTLALRLHICCLLLPMLIVSIVKDLKLMAPLSAISNVIIMVGMFLVVYYLVEDEVPLTNDMLFPKLKGLPVFVGTTMFALQSVGVVLALEYNMEKPNQFVGLFGLFNVGMSMITVLYTIVGILGYLKYGEAVKASVTLNLPFGEKKARATQMLLALAVFLSFPLQNFVAYNILWIKMKQKLAESRRRFIDYLLRVALIVGPWILAVALPHLGPFISFFGTLGFTLLGIIFPALMDICLWYPTTFGKCRYKLVRDVFLIILGFVALFSGCYTSLLSMHQAPTNKTIPPK